MLKNISLSIGSATPKSPTIRSPTMSNSPIGSAHNSDTENDPRTPGLLIKDFLFVFLKK
jgi:hypothetical protein